MRLYQKLDLVLMGWDTKADALELVKLIAEVGDTDGVEASELAAKLGWDVRRVNPACMYVDDMRWAKAFKYASGGPYVVRHFSPTPRTRRVARGQAD